MKEKYSYNFSLIGNFPYNISSQILFKAFENRAQLIKKQNAQLQADLESKGYTFISKQEKSKQTKLEKEFNNMQKSHK